MNREQLAELLNVNARIIEAYRRQRGLDPENDPSTILVIGSQSVHGLFSDYDLPEYASFSMEADLAYLPGRSDNDAFDRPTEEFADLLDAPTGEGSSWQDTHGFYSQGVEPTTACLPEGWEERLVPFEDARLPRTIRVVCLDPTDLCAAKLARCAPNDTRFVAAMVSKGLVDPMLLRERFETIPVDADFTEERKDIGRAFAGCLMREQQETVGGMEQRLLEEADAEYDRRMGGGEQKRKAAGLPDGGQWE